jgi:hypothetical protein
LFPLRGQNKKLNNRGDSVAIFNGVRNYGLLQAIDVTNPLKPCFFTKIFYGGGARQAAVAAHQSRPAAVQCVAAISYRPFVRQ